MKSFVRFIKSVKKEVIRRVIEIRYNSSMWVYKILLHYGKIDAHTYKMAVIFRTSMYCLKCIKHDLMNCTEAKDFLNNVMKN